MILRNVHAQNTDETNLQVNQKINTDDLGKLSDHDQLIVDFYNKYKEKQADLRNDNILNQAIISDERFVTACEMLRMGNDLKALKKEAQEDVQSYLKKVEKGFRTQSRLNHPDRLDEKNNPKLTNIATEVIKILGDAKEALFAFPKQFLSDELQNFATRLEKCPANEMESLVAEADTQKLLTSIDNIADLMKVLTGIMDSDNYEAFWSSSWVSTEFFNSLLRLIKTAYDLYDILFLLPKNKKKAFWELPEVMSLAVSALHPDTLVELPGVGLMAPNINDLNTILVILPDDKVIPFLNMPGVQEQLPNLINDKSDVDKILETLEIEEAREFIRALPFVKQIIKDAEDAVKSKNNFVETNHPNLLKIRAAIKQCLKQAAIEQGSMGTQINEGTQSNPGYQVRVIGWGGSDFLALFSALNTCSEEYGFTVKQTTKGDNSVLIVKENDPRVPLKDDFLAKLQKAYDAALPIEYHKANLKTLKNLIQKEGLAAETSVVKEGLNILKITGTQHELAALSKVLTELKASVNTQCTFEDGSLVLNLILEENSLIPYKFYGAFKKSYKAHLQQVSYEKAPQIERTMPLTPEETLPEQPLATGSVAQTQDNIPPESEEKIDLNISSPDKELKQPIPPVNINIKLKGGTASDKAVEHVPKKTMHRVFLENGEKRIAESTSIPSEELKETNPERFVAWLEAHNDILNFISNEKIEGKWILEVERHNADIAWEIIKQEIEEGRLWHVKISTNPKYDHHAVIVYVHDTGDTEHVKDIYRRLAECGLYDLAVKSSGIVYKLDKQSSYNMHGQNAYLYTSETIHLPNDKLKKMYEDLDSNLDRLNGCISFQADLHTYILVENAKYNHEKNKSEKEKIGFRVQIADKLKRYVDCQINIIRHILNKEKMNLTIEIPSFTYNETVVIRKDRLGTIIAREHEKYLPLEFIQAESPIQASNRKILISDRDSTLVDRKNAVINSDTVLDVIKEIDINPNYHWAIASAGGSELNADFGFKNIQKKLITDKGHVLRRNPGYVVFNRSSTLCRLVQSGTDITVINNQKDNTEQEKAQLAMECMTQCKDFELDKLIDYNGCQILVKHNAKFEIKFGDTVITIQADKFNKSLEAISSGDYKLFHIFDALDQAKLYVKLTNELKALGIVNITVPRGYNEVHPKDVIFLDDRVKNCAIVRKAGFTAIDADTYEANEHVDNNKQNTYLNSLSSLFIPTSFEYIKRCLIESEPFKNLVAHMEGSKKWRQINAYLVAIKSAKTFEELEIAVRDDPKHPLFDGMVWEHEKSMRENTGHNIYGRFFRGRSTTENYALKLEDLFESLTRELPIKKRSNTFTK